MGKYKQGILGGFSGKVGSVVGATWKGINYMQGLPAKSSKPPIAAQLAVRNRFTVTSNFLRQIMPIVKVSFANVASKTQSSYNAAFAYILKNCAVIRNGGASLSWNNLRVSDGKLPDTGSTTGNYTTWTSLQKRSVVIAWIRPEEGDERATDYVSVVVYNTAENQAVYSFQQYTRLQENAGVNIPYEWRRQDLKVFVFTCTADGKQFSRSLLLANLRAINI